MSAVSRSGAAARVVLVGVGGYGRVHAERLARLRAEGQVEVVAAADPVRSDVPAGIAGTPLFAELPEALRHARAGGPVDVVVIAAPIPEHARYARLALEAGADVLLEKPPVASLEDLTMLLETERRTGRVVQVGFQSLGSHGLARLRDPGLGIGDVRRIGATGAWSRTAGYWARAPWAGRRSLAGAPVVDGVVTNPLAHATATALAVAGCRRAEDVTGVQVDLYHANPIEADDTSALRIRTSRGLELTCAYTLCAEVETDPVVHVAGSSGRAEFAYTADRLEITRPGRESETVRVGRDDLLENLLAHRRDGAALLVPLVETGAFMRVLDAVAGTEPTPVDPRFVSYAGVGDGRRPILQHIDADLRRAVEAGRTFAELGLPWTRS